MNPELKKQVTVGALIVVLLGVVLYLFVVLKSPSGGSTSPRPRSTTMTGPDAAKVALMKVDVDLDALLSGTEVVNFVYQSEKIDRDPMTPVRPIAKETGTGPVPPPRETEKIRFIYEMKVTGIIYSPYRPMAIVDDQLVTIGHEYGEGIRIVAIDRERVWFDVDDARVPLELKEL